MTFGVRFLFFFSLCAIVALPAAAFVTYAVGSLLGYQMTYTLTSSSLAAVGQAVTERARIDLLFTGPFTNLGLCFLALVGAYLIPTRMGFLLALSLANNFARSLPETTSLLLSEPNPYDLEVVKAAKLMGWPTWSLVVALFPLYIFALLLVTRMVKGRDSVKLIFLITTIAVGLTINLAIHTIDPFLFRH